MTYRPQFLVSVQDETEASFVAELGVDILDFKAPQSGPLSPVPASIWSWAVESIQTLPLSAALGEVPEAESCIDQLPPQFCFAKVGLSKMKSETQIAKIWQNLKNRLSPQTQLVAVAYADHHAAESLAAEQIFDLANHFGLSWLLIDTFRKGGPSSIQTLGWQRIQSLCTSARANDQLLTIAGSIRHSDLPSFQSHRIRAHAFGARGDLCPGPRHHRLDQGRIRRWIKSLESFTRTE